VDKFFRFRNSVVATAFILFGAVFPAAANFVPLTCEDRFSGPVSVAMCHLGEGLFSVFEIFLGNFLGIFLTIVGGGAVLSMYLTVLIPLGILNELVAALGL